MSNKKLCKKKHPLLLICLNISSASKFLLVIGGLTLLQTLLCVFLDNSSSSIYDVSIRSVMSNVFGYFFGNQLNPKILPKNTKSSTEAITTIDNDDSKAENEEAQTPDFKDFKEVQTLVGGLIAIICLVAVIMCNILKINPNKASVVEIRNLLFASVGFLLSKAKSI